MTQTTPIWSDEQVEAAISLIERAQLNTPPVYTAWHDAAHAFLNAVASIPSSKREEPWGIFLDASQDDPALPK